MPKSCFASDVRVAIDEHYCAPQRADLSGGDFCAYAQQPDGTVCCVVGDVSAKATRGTELADALRRAFCDACTSGRRPSEHLRALNATMIDRSADGDGEYFATALVLSLRSDGAVRYASAGAVGPLLARDGGCKALGTPHDLLLGLDRDAAYAERTYALAPGDRLVVVTDGVFESRHDRFRRRRLGIRTVARVIEAAHRRAVALTATRIFEDLEAYNGGRYEDDATIVVASALANVTARAKTPQ